MTAATVSRPLTEEQENARGLMLAGSNLAIEAGAGTGKTTTLVACAQAASKLRIQYVAFNKAIVNESKAKMPPNTQCNTAHSLAFKQVGHKYRTRLDRSARMKSTEIAKILGIESMKVRTWTGDEKLLGAGFLAGLTMRAVTRFCQTADPDPTVYHVPFVQGLDVPKGGDRPATYDANRAVQAHIEPALHKAWADLSRTSGLLPYKHDHYLKTWQLNDPKIPVDVILFDEAQDASPVLIDAIGQQRNAQVVWVGDSQQAIYEFTGAVNALAEVPSDARAFLTQSFRFGPVIADTANEILAKLNAELRLVGFDKIKSRLEYLEEPGAILARTNAEAVRSMIDSMAAGRTAHLVGGGSEVTRFCRAAQDLINGDRTDHPELACFESWGEVQTYVEEDEQGGELRLMVKLIDEFTVEAILRALNSAAIEARADVVISTAHKSKGREWPKVQIAGDFPVTDEPSEDRLLYVAVTRAQNVLDCTNVPMFNDR